MPTYALADLARDPSVRHISVDHKVSAKMAGDVNAVTVNAPQAWAKDYAGAGIGVAVIDSGFTLLSDFSGPGRCRAPCTRRPDLAD